MPLLFQAGNLAQALLNSFLEEDRELTRATLGLSGPLCQRSQEAIAAALLCLQTGELLLTARASLSRRVQPLIREQLNCIAGNTEADPGAYIARYTCDAVSVVAYRSCEFKVRS